MFGVVSESKIIGEAVVNRQNENLGKIRELVIDAKEGRLPCEFLLSGIIAFNHGISVRRGRKAADL
jgi:sporulation protein YlmC with PRC-barrel domain